MGILILAVLFVGAVTIIRWVATLIPSVKKTPTPSIPPKPELVALESQSDFTSFETPAFIRRGLQYPVLTEKPKKRTRKAKVAMAVA